MGDIEVLLNAPSFNKLQIVSGAAIKRATTAGDLLSCMYLTHKFEQRSGTLKSSSITKAIQVLKKLALTTSFGDGDVPPRSTATIRAYWEEFKPVAHFWAAIRISNFFSVTRDGEVFAPETFSEYLKVAAELQNFGTTYCPPHTKTPTPVMNQHRIWSLSETQSSHYLNGNQVPYSVKKFLETYQSYLTKHL